MRVAIVSECFLPVINGVTNSVRRIAPHLGASGHDVLIVPRKRCAALRDGMRRLLDPAVRARFGATARPSVLRRTWTTVGDDLVAHYGAVLDEFSVKCAVGVATPVPGSARPHVA